MVTLHGREVRGQELVFSGRAVGSRGASEHAPLCSFKGDKMWGEVAEISLQGLRRCAAVGVEQPLRDAEMCMYGISLTHISQADYE